MQARIRIAIALVLSVVLISCQGSTPSAGPDKPAAGEKPAAATSATEKPVAVPSKQGGEATRGGTLRLGHQSNPASLDPLRGASQADFHVLYAIYSPLVDVDPALSPKPGLAESWEASSDLKTYTFKLRKGVKFHDGTDFNAEAVKAHIERIMNPAAKSTVTLGEVQSVDVVDDLTVKFNLKMPSVSLPLFLSDRAGMIPSPTAVKKFGEDFGRNPVGAGPFRFIEWLEDDHITLRRSDTYWEKGLPYLDGLEYKIIPDQSVQLTNVRSGALDVMQGVPAADVARLEQSPEVKVLQGAGSSPLMMRINSLRPPFDNKALRQAVALALNQEALVKGLLFGLGEPAYGLIPLTSWAYDPNINPVKRDLTKAREKLAEGGKPNGFRFEFLIINRPDFVQVAQAIKAQLSEVGIDMDIIPLTSAELVSRVNTKDLAYSASISGGTGQIELNDWFTRLFHTTGMWNSGRFGALSGKIDPLVEKARGTQDPKVRKDLYRQVQAIVNDEALDVFFYYTRLIIAMNPKVENYKIWGDDKMRFKEVWMRK